MIWRRVFRGFDVKLLLGVAAIVVAIPLAHLVNNLASRDAQTLQIVKADHRQQRLARVESSRERHRLIDQNQRMLDELSAVRAHDRALIAYIRSRGIPVPPGFDDAAAPVPKGSSPKGDRGARPVSPSRPGHPSSPPSTKPTKPPRPPKPPVPSGPPTITLPVPTPLCVLHIVCVKS